MGQGLHVNTAPVNSEESDLGLYTVRSMDAYTVLIHEVCMVTVSSLLVHILKL